MRSSNFRTSKRICTGKTNNGPTTSSIYLMQEYVDTYDKEALLVLLDMEKAFDRCSWEFLKKAMDKIGLEEEIKRWIGTIYNETRPPIRQIKMNGRKSHQFKIGSGVL